MTTTDTTNEKDEPSSSCYDKYLVPLAIPCVYYYPSLLEPTAASALYDDLHKNVQWSKTAKINRWVALYELEPANDYKYRDAPATGSAVFLDSIRQVKDQVEALYLQLTGRQVQFNTCLANFYQNGQQRIGWHTDREEIGRTTPIASVSLGAVRQFCIRHKQRGQADRAAVDLASGSVVFMENACQVEYLHAVPKQPDVAAGRINLTFRCKTAATAGEAEHERRDHWLDDVAQDYNNINDDDDIKQQQILLGGQDGFVPLFGSNAQTEFSNPQSPRVMYSVSCNIGTEACVAAEVMELLQNDPGWEVVATPFVVYGYVAICALDDGDNDTDSGKANTDVVATLLKLRSVLNVMEYHDFFPLQQAKPGVPLAQIDGEALYQFYKKRLEANPSLIPSLAAATPDQPRTFRVTSDRIGGPHAFQAPNVEYEVGGAMSEFYTACKPKMTDYDVRVRVDVVGDKVMVGTQLNVEDLSKRHFVRYRNVVTIKTNLSYGKRVVLVVLVVTVCLPCRNPLFSLRCFSLLIVRGMFLVMLRLANIQKGNLIVDPFCGSGTVLLEALEITDKSVRCIGMDVSRRCAEGSQENATAEGYSPETCVFHACDARGIRKHVADGSVDAIVTNLPWGVRTGHKQGVADLQQTYEAFLRSAWYTLKPKGRIVMLVLRGLQMIRILRKLGGRYRILSIMIVRTTNNLPSIIVVEKLEKDVLRDLLKRQLAKLSPFVNVSAEMYHAITYEDIDEAN